jgi:ribonuclease inhibitor
MRKLELDGSRIKTESDFHTEISRLLEFPDWYGNNLDALEDFLNGHIDPNVCLVWKHHELSKKQLGNDFERIMSVFNDFMQSEPNFEVILS